MNNNISMKLPESLEKSLEDMIEILDNVQYLEGCPAEYITLIQEFLVEHTEQSPEMTTTDWRRVIGEGFYVVRDGFCKLRSITELTGRKTVFHFDTGTSDSAPPIVREKGTRQPHFKGHRHPEGDTMVVVTYMEGSVIHGTARMCDWDGVKEYIVL